MSIPFERWINDNMRKIIAVLIALFAVHLAANLVVGLHKNSVASVSAIMRASKDPCMAEHLRSWAADGQSAPLTFEDLIKMESVCKDDEGLTADKQREAIFSLRN